MKRVISLLLLLAGLTAAAQNAVLNNSAKYEQFKELRNQADTLGMKQMLDTWGDKDPEYYAAWSNYCSVMAVETENPTWTPMSVNWIKMGRDAFPDDRLLLLKYPQVLFDNEQFAEALPVLLEIEEKGIPDPASWEYLAEIYLMKNDLDNSRKYLKKVVAEAPDEEERMYARMNLETFDRIEHEADSLRLRLDHPAIEKFAKTAAFKKLVTRFAACDTTLTREEIANVYYGSAYGKDYNWVDSDSEGIQKLVDEGKVQEALASLQAKLQEYPASLFLLISIFNLADDQALVESCVWKARALLSAIDNSGNGTTPDSPLQVISVNDEYMYLNQVCESQGLRSQSLLNNIPNGPQDQMVFVNSFGLDQTLYFYLTPPYWKRLDAMTRTK